MPKPLRTLSGTTSALAISLALAATPLLAADGDGGRFSPGAGGGGGASNYGNGGGGGGFNYAGGDGSQSGGGAGGDFVSNPGGGGGTSSGGGAGGGGGGAGGNAGSAGSSGSGGGGGGGEAGSGGGGGSISDIAGGNGGGDSGGVGGWGDTGGGGGGATGGGGGGGGAYGAGGGGGYRGFYGDASTFANGAYQGGGGGGGGGAGGGGGGGAGVVLDGGVFAGMGSASVIRGGAGGGGGGDGITAAAGGNGGTGLLLLNLPTADFSVAGTIIGGAGGNGGNGSLVNGTGGTGGNGARGIGIEGNSGALTITVAGTVFGGRGGRGGAGSNPSTTGNGGAAIEGANLAIMLADGSNIAGGLSGDFTTRAAAISFTGGQNSLAFGSGGTWALTGAIELQGASSVTFNQASDLTLANVISGTGSVVKAGANTLTLTSANTYTGGTTVSAGILAAVNSGALGAGNITVASGASLQLNNGVTIANAISLAGTGPSNIGALRVAAGSATVSGDVTLTAASSIGLSSASTLTISGTLGGAFTLNRTSSDGGTLVLTGNNSGSQTSLNIAEGALSIANQTNLPGGTLTLNTGNTNTDGLRVTGSDVTISKNITAGFSGARVTNDNTVTLSGVIGGGGTTATRAIFTKAGSGKLILTGTNTYAVSPTANAGTQVLGGILSITDDNNLGGGAVLLNGGGLEVTGTSAAIARNITLQRANSAISATNSATVSGVISGVGGLTSAGAGTLILTGTNTYTDSTTISAGTLALSGSGSIASTSSVAVAGTFDISGTTSGASIQGLSGAGQIALGGQTLTLAGNSSGSFEGTVTGIGGGLTKTGTGTFTLSGASDYTGTTTVSAGTLVAASSGALGGSAGGTTVSSGAALQLNNGVTIADAISLAGVGSSNMGALQVAAGSATVAGDVTLTAATSIGLANASTLTISGTLGGAFTLNRTSSDGGTLVLTGNNSGSQTSLNIAEGALSIANQTNLPGGSLTLNTGNTNTDGLRVTGSDVTISKNINAGFSGARVTNDNTVTLSGVIGGGGTTATRVIFTKAGSGKLILTGNNTYAVSPSAIAGTQVLGGILSITDDNNLGGGAVLLNAGGLEVTGNAATIARNIRLQTNGAISATSSATVSGVISGAGSLTSAGAGTLTLTGVNTYTGGTTFSAGTLQIAADTALGSGGGLTFAGGALATTADIATSRNIAVGSNGGTLSTAQDTTLTVNGVVSGTGTLTKSGAGTLALAGASTFSGITNVETGTLSMAAGSTLPGAVNIKTGATLTGSGGNLTGTVTVENGGILSGTAANRLSVGALTLSAGAITNVTLGAASLTPLFTADALTVDGTLNVTADTGYGIGIYRIFSSTAALTDNGLALGTAPSGGPAAQLQIGSTTVDVAVLDTSLQYWSPGGGTTQGGDGNWTSAGTSWLNVDDARSAWGGQMGVFGGTAGTVTVSGTQGFGTLEFLTSGYNIVGGLHGALDLGGGGRLWAEGADTTATVGLEITGTGALTKIGAGTIVLAGSNTYQGGTVIQAGTLQISDNHALGASAGGVTFEGGTLAVTQGMASTRAFAFDAGGGTMNIAEGTTTALSGTLSGAGDVTKAGAGTLTLSGDSSGLSGKLFVQQGTLALSGTSRLDGMQSVVVNGALDIHATTGPQGLKNLSGGGSGQVVLGARNVEIVQTAATAFAGTISGTGGITVGGNSVLILTGANTYTGGTTILDDATLQIGDGGTTGSITGHVANDGALVFNRSGSYTFDGTIAGPGRVSFTGGGTVLFSNPDAYSGDIGVDGGNVVLANGSSSSASYTINNGGVLSGNGTVGGLVVNNGGVASPGNSPGTINVAGPVAFNSGGVYRVDVTPTGQHDRITATGAVTIDSGANVQVLAVPGAYAANATYTILSTTAARTGTFGGVTSDFAFLKPALAYDSQNVFLTLAYDDGSNGGGGGGSPGFASYATTANELASSNAAQTLGIGNPLFDAIVTLPVSGVPGVFNAISGEIHASARTALVEESGAVRSAAVDRLRSAFGAVGGAPMPTMTYGFAADRAPATTGLMPALRSDRFAVWGQGYGSFGRSDATANAARLTRSTGGFLLGADVAAFDTLRFGLLAGYSRTEFKVNRRLSSGESDNYHLGLYGGGQWGALGLRLGASYSWHDVETRRTVSFAGFGDRLTSDYRAGTAQIFGELGYRIDLARIALEPFAGLAYVNLRTDGFREIGGAAALTARSRTTGVGYTTLGLRASSNFALSGMDLTLRGALAWRHAFGDVDPQATLAFAGSAPFSTAGVPIAKNAALLEAGARRLLHRPARNRRPGPRLQGKPRRQVLRRADPAVARRCRAAASCDSGSEAAAAKRTFGKRRHSCGQA
ncbi:autotransporter domain-containing protein [Bosea sp. Root381]|uniref:autotransporter domain-containing protein n=1 Tax=Bosea sp. Root381 TaxID=1736524 RepID=UPI0012E3CFA3|nr:autotransporter domain-containing protein [Bosea sp. Root381]